MSNILAGIGRGQMEVLDLRVRQRRDNFSFYNKNLKDYDGIRFLIEPDLTYYSNHWLTAILIDPIKAGLSPGEIQSALNNENIASSRLWKPMHLQPVFSSCPAYLNGTSEEFFNNGLCLPSGTNMTDMDRSRVLDSIINCLKKKV